jgi:hypothetical protein
MPKRKPDRASDLLRIREQDYQSALHIARNDLLFEEDKLNKIEQSLLQDGINRPDVLEYISNKRSLIRRARRDLVSEGSNLFENDLLNYQLGIQSQEDITGNTTKTEAGQRSISQAIPGTEAHHPASVSSTEALVQNMDEYEIRKLWGIAKDNGYTVGSLAEGFIPLSKPAHTTGGRNWGSDYAHVGKDGKSPDPGRFKTTPLPKGTTADQAWTSLKPILDEQILLNERAYNHPFETKMRQQAEQIMGRPLTWRGSSNNKVQRDEAKLKGINATTITKSYDRSPGLAKTNFTPGVDIMTSVGARIPNALKLGPDRQALKALAIAGLAAPSVLGSAASAAESVGRTQVARDSGNPIDWAQAGLAYASSVGDAAGYTGIGAVPGEILSTVADGANVLIDSARQPAPRPTYVPTQARVQARTATTSAARKQGQMMPKPAAKPLNVVNEANYFIVNPIKNALKTVFGNREI